MRFAGPRLNERVEERMGLQTPMVLSLIALLLLGSAASAQLLQFRILEREQEKKGGSRSNRYVLRGTYFSS